MQKEFTSEKRIFSSIKEQNCLGFVDRYARPLMSLSFILTDMMMVASSGLIAYALRVFVLGEIGPEILNWLPLMTILCVFIYATRNLYPAIGMGMVEEFRTLTLTSSLIFLLLLAVEFIIHSPTSFSRLVVVFMYGLVLLFVPVGRIVTRHFFSRFPWWGEPAVVIGPIPTAQKIADRFLGSPKIGLRPTVIYTPDFEKGKTLQNLTVLPTKYLDDLLNSHIRTGIIVYQNFDQLEGLHQYYQDTFERLILMKDSDNGLTLSGLSVQEYGGLLSFQFFQNLLDRRAQFQKRLMDILISGFGLLLLLPFFGLMALLIWLESPGPVFYRQLRLGKKGKIIGVLKFRSMCVDAEKILETYLAENPTAQWEWAQFQKLKQDPRITRVGALIRRFSIDELPQLWNVFKGEMSLVGPRPIMLNQQTIYGENLEQYKRVLPGITGLWQISGRNRTTFAKRVTYDLHYVMNWSIWLDIYILIRTIWVVIIRDGAG
jgi:Undecaprenyl-phosphate galactose phosphotransferase WbaP